MHHKIKKITCKCNISKRSDNTSYPRLNLNHNRKNPETEIQVGSGRKFALRQISKRLAPLWPGRKSGSVKQQADWVYAKLANHIEPQNGHYYDVSFDKLWAAIQKCKRSELASWVSKEDVWLAYNDMPSKEKIFEDDNIVIFRKVGGVK